MPYQALHILYMETINSKYQFRCGNIGFSYVMIRILYQIFKIILRISLKKHGEVTYNPPIRIYVNKIENRITFKIKTGYHLKHLAPETMKLLKITKSKITKNKNGENIPHLEIIEAVLVDSNIFQIIIKMI